LAPPARPVVVSRSECLSAATASSTGRNGPLSHAPLNQQIRPCGSASLSPPPDTAAPHPPPPPAAGPLLRALPPPVLDSPAGRTAGRVSRNTASARQFARRVGCGPDGDHSPCSARSPAHPASGC